MTVRTAAAHPCLYFGQGKPALMKRCLLLSVAIWLALPSMSAYADGGPPPGYSQRVYRVTDGLPEATVQAFAQTPDHFLWIGTTGGLVRFDGTHFTTFDRESTPAFKENSVFCMLTAADGSLWLGMEGSGLIHLRDGIFQSFGMDNGLTDSFVRAITQDSAGNIWIGTNNGLFRIRAGDPASHIDRLDNTPAIPALAVNSFHEDSRGRLWLGGSRLATLSRDGLHIYQLPGDPVRNRVKAIAESSDGVIWVGTVSGLYRLLPTDPHFEEVPRVRGTVRVIRQSPGGALWVGVVGHGASVYRIDASKHLIDPVVLSSETVLTSFEDTEQNLWLGTETGMIRFTPTPLSIVALPNAKDSDFGTVYRDRENTLWAASTRLYHVRNGIPQPYDLPELSGARVRDVYQERDGGLWFGTDGSGIFHKTQTSVRHYTYRDGLANNFIRAILQSADGSMWIGTDEGISHLQGDRFTNFGMKDGLAYQSTRAMLEDHAGDLWIGTEQGLSHLHRGTFVSGAAVIAMRQDKVWAIHQDSDGTLWFGTRNNGLYRLRAGDLTHFTTADGLASHSIYDIREDNAGHFWLSGPTGISLLDRHELDRVADHKIKQLSLSFYGIAGETETTRLFGGMQSAGAILPAGDVWFPSNRGLIHISPGSAPRLPLPPIAITRVVADGREISASAGISLPAGNSRLEINYTPIMMRPQDAVRFRYRLEGLEKDWNEAGTRHIADYTNVPPGHYTFHVMAFEMSNPDRIAEASLGFYKSPHFYRTWWFIGCCLLLLAAAILAIHRLRVARIRRRFQAVLEERNRLAREMHDTLLQGCTSVSAALEAVSSLHADKESLKQVLVESARTQIRTTINEARDAVWQLRRDSETPQDLSGLIDSMGRQLSQELGVPIDCNFRGEQFVIDRPVAHELIMITREAVYNAARHASPTLVRLSVDFRPDTLAVGIADDGCGFEPVLASNDEHMHFGIVGMKERVARLGGTFHLESRANAGTEIAICVPRKVTISSQEDFYSL